MATVTHCNLGLHISRRNYIPILLPSLPRRSFPFRHSHSVPKKSIRVLRSVLPGEEVMQVFIKDRQINGDFVSKVYDNLWRKGDIKFTDKEVIVGEDKDQHIDLVSSENVAPINKNLVTNIRKWKDDRDKRKELNILKYEALKGELLLLALGIGAACGLYCLISLSTEAAISYAVGVLLSCLYLQLLSTYTDNLSKESIPVIFIQKKVKKSGIRSEDLKNALDKLLNGINIALSSPRLVIPAAIYGLWDLSHKFLNIFDFQLVPAMLGFFVYKAAALVQVYRDNEDLSIIFPDYEDNSKEQ